MTGRRWRWQEAGDGRRWQETGEGRRQEVEMAGDGRRQEVEMAAPRWGRWFHPRKFATATNYPVEEEVAGRRYEDVPVEEIEGGKHQVPSCQPL